MINSVASADPAVSAGFFGQYFLGILQDLFFVLTDSEHKGSFKGQTTLLARLFYLVESHQIQSPLWDPATVTDPSMTNPTFVRQYCAELLHNAFPHMRV
jgi:exportin-1